MCVCGAWGPGPYKLKMIATHAHIHMGWYVWSMWQHDICMKRFMIKMCARTMLNKENSKTAWLQIPIDIYSKYASFPIQYCFFQFSVIACLTLIWTLNFDHIDLHNSLWIPPTFKQPMEPYLDHFTYWKPSN